MLGREYRRVHCQQRAVDQIYAARHCACVRCKGDLVARRHAELRRISKCPIRHQRFVCIQLIAGSIAERAFTLPKVLILVPACGRMGYGIAFRVQLVTCCRACHAKFKLRAVRQFCKRFVVYRYSFVVYRYSFVVYRYFRREIVCTISQKIKCAVRQRVEREFRVLAAVRQRTAQRRTPARLARAYARERSACFFIFLLFVQAARQREVTCSAACRRQLQLIAARHAQTCAFYK